jgi:hypothetical protein
MKCLRVLGMIVTRLAVALSPYFNNIKILICIDNVQTSILTTQKTQSIIIRKVNRVMLFMEWIAVYIEN